MMRFKKTWIIMVLIVLFLVTFTLAGCSRVNNNEQAPVRIGWTNHTENAILGNMIAIVLDKKLGIPVKTVGDLGGTGIAHEAIISGELDIYPDYTGDALANVLKMDPVSDPEEAFLACKEGYLEKFDITWLDPTPFNNTYALAIKKEIADELDILAISDLKDKAPEWVIGSSVEFSKRPLDGYQGLIKHYGFEFKENKPMESGLMYTAAYNGDVEVIVAFATDARIGKFNLKVLDDDKQFFPCYNAAPTVRNEILERYPQIEDLLNEIFSNLDTETMISLNGEVDIDLKDPAKVAEGYLKKKGYID